MSKKRSSTLCSPQGPRSSAQPPTRSAVLPRRSRVCSAALWIFVPQTSRPSGYNPSRVSRCECEHAAEPESSSESAFFLPFCDSQMWVALGGEPASGSRSEAGPQAAADEREARERLTEQDAPLLPTSGSPQSSAFNHLRPRRKYNSGINLILRSWNVYWINNLMPLQMSKIKRVWKLLPTF